MRSTHGDGRLTIAKMAMARMPPTDSMSFHENSQSLLGRNAPADPDTYGIARDPNEPLETILKKKSGRLRLPKIKS